MKGKVWGWVAIVIFTLVCFILAIFNYMAITYPIKYFDIVNRCAKEYKLDVALIMSVINVESSFDKSAISNANALGLMQLKLTTANDMAKLCGDNPINFENLFDVELNIKYGCMYLKYLYDYYNDINLSLCAYNAGLGNVNNWLNDISNIDDEGNLCNIPFKETREYLNKVNRNIKIYNTYISLNLIKI